MIKIVFTLILGIMSLLIIKEYLEILLINKMLKHQWLFWELNLIVTIILENDTGMPWKNLLLNVIYVFYICMVGYHGKVREKIMTTFSLIAIWAISEAIVEYSARMSHIYFVEPAIQGTIASKLLTLSIIEVIKYIVSRYILKDVDRELPGYWWLLTFMPVCCIGIIYFIYYLVEKRPENGVVFGAMLSSCLFLPLNLGIFKIYDLLSREFLLKQQNVIYEQNIRLFSEEMRMKEESLISRNIIHDYRKHFLVIQGMAYGEQCEEIVQYLDKLNIYYEKEKSLVNCGNFVIDAMMNSKYLIACKENIKHEDRIVVPEAMNFEDVDLCILLGNMLDNAYEATKKAEKKIINTSIIYSKGKLTIGVKNTYDGIIEKDRKGNYISTKMNKTNHGMGIKLMQRIVDKYNGFLSLENDDNYFVVIAVLIEKIM